MALASNRSLAEQNLDMKPRLESQKEVLVERYSQLQSVRDTYRKHCSLRGTSWWMQVGLSCQLYSLVSFLILNRLWSLQNSLHCSVSIKGC